MFGDYGSVFDAATADNVSVRDRALSVAQLEPGRATVYGAHQAGGMLMQNLAGMAGMKTARQEKAELITKIMEESQGLDPNNPNSSLILSQKFASAGFPNIAQKFAQKYRDMSVKDREQERLEESAATLKEYYEKTTEIQADRLEFEGEKEVTRKEELAAALKVSLAEVTRLINKGELIEIPVEGNTTGAMMWARFTYDKEGLNQKITPLKSPAVTQGAVTDVSTTSPTDDTPAAVATEEVLNLNTHEGLANSGLMISSFGQDIGAKQRIDAEKRERIAANIETSYKGDSESTEGIKDIRELIREAVSGGELGVWDGSLTDSTVYRDLGRNLATLTSSERLAEKQISAEEAAALRIAKDRENIKYGPALQRSGDAERIAMGAMMQIGTEGDKAKSEILADQIGADIGSYDLILGNDREWNKFNVVGEENVAFGVTPTFARSNNMYERALSLPEVYKSGSFAFGPDTYNPEAFKTALNKSFDREGEIVTKEERRRYILAGLVIPFVTRLESDIEGERPGPMSQEQLNYHIAKYREEEKK